MNIDIQGICRVVVWSTSSEDAWREIVAHEIIRGLLSELLERWQTHLLAELSLQALHCQATLSFG